MNGEDIFKEYRNYNYFLSKYALYIESIAQTYSYCLLKNHFHIAIRTKKEEEILDFYKLKHPNKTQIPDAKQIISQQFSFLFNSYAQSINKSYGRTGGLFEEQFRRILVENDTYLKDLIVYIHRNPQNHHFVNYFKTYEHSSYHSILKESKTKLLREEVLKLFDGKENYINSHESDMDLIDWKKLGVE